MHAFLDIQPDPELHAFQVNPRVDQVREPAAFIREHPRCLVATRAVTADQVDERHIEQIENCEDINPRYRISREHRSPFGRIVIDEPEYLQLRVSCRNPAEQPLHVRVGCAIESYPRHGVILAGTLWTIASP